MFSSLLMYNLQAGNPYRADEDEPVVAGTEETDVLILDAPELTLQAGNPDGADEDEPVVAGTEAKRPKSDGSEDEEEDNVEEVG